MTDTVISSGQPSRSNDGRGRGSGQGWERSATGAGTDSLVRAHQLVTGVLGAQPGELGGTGILIGTEPVGELTRTDVVEDRLHGSSDVSVDHSRASQQTAVLGGGGL